MASPRIPFNRHLWRQVHNIVQAQQAEISRYVRTYIDTYETLRESFMNRYTDQPLRLLRAGTSGEMEAEVKTLYERIHANAMRFQEVFLRIKNILSLLVVEMNPSATHESTLVIALNQARGCSRQTEQLELEIGALRNEILDREGYYSMMAVHHPPHALPAYAGNWFTIRQEDGQVGHIDWYRTAHTRLLEDFDRAEAIVQSKINSFKLLHSKVLRLCMKYFKRLKANVPDFMQACNTLARIGEGVQSLQREIVNLREHKRTSGNERRWRLPTLRLINVLSPLVDKQMKNLKFILATFIVFREQYIRSNASNLDDVMSEFAATFMKK